MLIGEVVPLSLAYLRQNPMAPERVRYQHVLVDEYQDLNRAEQVLIDLLAGDGNLAINLRDLPDRIRFRISQPEVPLEATYARVMSFQKSKRVDGGSGGACRLGGRRNAKAR